jgi:hypothetical protein
MQEGFVSTPEAPITYYLRKKEPPATVVPRELTLKLNQQRTEYEVDLIEGSRAVPGTFGKARFQRTKHADFLVKYRLAEDRKNYELIFQAPDQESGVVLNDQLLYVAPEQGYLQAERTVIPITGEIKKFLYVKGRKGNLFSRVDLDIRARADNSVIVTMKAWTNPAGSRTVDFDSEKYGLWLDEQVLKRRR